MAARPAAEDRHERIYRADLARLGFHRCTQHCGDGPYVTGDPATDRGE